MSSEINRTYATQDAVPSGVQLCTPWRRPSTTRRDQGHGAVNQSLTSQSPTLLQKAGPASESLLVRTSWSWRSIVKCSFNTECGGQFIAGLGYSAYFTVAVSPWDKTWHTVSSLNTGWVACLWVCVNTPSLGTQYLSQTSCGDCHQLEEHNIS